MRTKTIVATVVAAGLVGAGLVAVPAVIAADSPSPMSYGARWGAGDDRPGGPMMGGAMMSGRGQGDGSGRQRGWGMGWGMGRDMWRDMGRDDAAGPGGRGWCGGPLGGTAARGTLTPAQQQDLAAQAGVEKLSHDVYLAFADSTGDPRFAHIAWSETRHLAAVRSLLGRYDVTDPTAGDRVGEFATDALRAAYDAALAQGSGSLRDALDVAAGLERTDIDGLAAAARGLDAPDVKQVYAHLAMASRMHLAAFSG
jgi:hypothetical protein